MGISTEIGKILKMLKSKFEKDGAVFWFTVMADNFSEALKMISEDQYMSDMTFYKLEIEEVEEVEE